jgi:hypothetical protein
MPTNGWTKRMVTNTLIAEIDQFEEVMADRILIEEEIALIEAMIANATRVGEGSAYEQMGVDLDRSLMLAREKLRNLG